MLFANFPSQERKFYLLASGLLVSALVLGLVSGVIGAGENVDARPDNWQASALPVGADTLADFTAVTTQSRWFVEGGQPSTAIKSVEGEPEGFRLLGIVNKGNQRFALFMPPATEVGRSKLVQVGVGEALVGDWQIKEIASAKVLVALGEELRELSLYGDKVVKSQQAKAGIVKHKPGVTRRAAKAADNNVAPGNTKVKSGDKPKAQDKAKPKKDKTEMERARVERQEQKAKARAAAAKQKAESDNTSKHKTP